MMTITGFRPMKNRKTGPCWAAQAESTSGINWPLISDTLPSSQAGRGPGMCRSRLRRARLRPYSQSTCTGPEGSELRIFASREVGLQTLVSHPRVHVHLAILSLSTLIDKWL